MIALFWFVAVAVVLVLLAPPLLFACLSLQPHLRRRTLLGAVSQGRPRVSKVSVRSTPATV
jgi:hypothetical protein